MNISSDSKYTIYRHKGKYGYNYTIGLFKKDKEGNYINGYMSVMFKKNIEVSDKEQIYIKKAWLSFNKNKENKKTYPYIFIDEYETVDDKIEEGKKVLNEKDDYEQFAEETNITESDLPF